VLVEAHRYIDLVQRIVRDEGTDSDLAALSLMLDRGFAREAYRAIGEVLHLRNIDAPAFAERHAVAERMTARLRATSGPKNGGGRGQP